MNRIAKFIVGALAVTALTYFVGAYEIKIQERTAKACDPSDPGCH